MTWEQMSLFTDEELGVKKPMTHDDLLMLVTGGTNHTMAEEHLLYRKALRAVVELTQTYKDDSYVNEEFNQGLQTAFRLVIQAIEKELG